MHSKKKFNTSISYVFIVGIALLSLVSCFGQTQSQSPQAQPSLLSTILEGGVLKVGTTGDFNPISFKDPSTGEYVGHDIDLITQLGKDMGVKIEYVPTDWKNLVSGVSAGKYHITTQASYNSGRAKTVGYTDPVQSVGTVPLTLKKNINKFRTWDDANKSTVKVAVTLGTVFDEQTKQLLPQAQRVVVESPARDFQELLAGRADVSITSNIEASQLIKTYPELVVFANATPEFANVMGLLVPQKDAVLANYLNVWIRQKKAGGFIDKLKDRWLALN